MPATIRPRARIARRRSAATLVSHLTPPLAQAGLYRGLLDLKASLDRWRVLAPDAEDERRRLATVVQAQAAAVDLADAEPAWGNAAGRRMDALKSAVLELEYTLIPHGLHVVGAPLSDEERRELLAAMAEAAGRRATMWRTVLADAEAHLAEDHEIPAILHALDGGFIRPAPGGDILRTPAILPTGRNLHGFDPFRIPSAFAVADGARQAAAPARPPHAAGQRPAGDPRAGALGHRQPEERGRPDRAGAGPDRRPAALRQLRPARRRRASCRWTSSAARASTW